MGTETNEMPPHCGFLTDKGIELLLDNEIVIHPRKRSGFQKILAGLSIQR